MKFDTSVDEIRATFTSVPEKGELFWNIEHNSKHKGDKAGGFSRQKNEFIVTYNHLIYRRAEIIYAIELGYWPKEKLKHINKDRKDDRFNNLILKSDLIYLGPKKITYHEDKNEFTIFNQDVGTFASFLKAKSYFIASTLAK